jgi:membrane fusion protein, multidrug efflux system
VQRLRVLAPFDAVAGIRLVQVGDYLRDGADVVTLDDVGSLYIDFKLPEKYVPQVKRGSTVEAQVDALPNRRFTGQVIALDSQVDSSGRALLVRAELRNPEGSLRPGMFARARLVFAVRDKAVLYLYKLVSGPNGGLVSQRIEARLGARMPGKVEVLEGLSDGDTVVTAGQGRLARGDKLPVRVIDIDKPGGGRPGGKPGGPPAGKGEAKGEGAGGAKSGAAPSASGAAAGGAPIQAGADTPRAGPAASRAAP